MKKMIFISIFICIQIFFLQAQPAKLNTPLPCHAYDNSVAWSEPKYYKICSDTILSLNQQGFQKCCYWIVYHERLRKVPNGTDTCYHQEVNVTTIVYEGIDCKKRTNGEIINAFHNSIYKKYSVLNPSYYINCGDDADNNSRTMQFYSTGGCFQTSNGELSKDEKGKPIPCDTLINFCCEYSKQLQVEFGKVTRVDTILSSPEHTNTEPYYEVYDSTHSLCGTPCQKSCDEILSVNYLEMNCYQPCNNGSWDSKPPLELTVPGCPDCKLVVHYSTRTTSPCPEIANNNYQDLQLDMIEYDSAGCSLCNLTLQPMQSIHSWVIDELIKVGFNNYPPNGTTSPYYRVFYSSCWSDFFTEGCCPDSLGNLKWPPERVLKPCYSNSCCIRKYSISTNNGIGTYTLVEVIMPESIDCPLYIYEPCVFICGEED